MISLVLFSMLFMFVQLGAMQESDASQPTNFTKVFWNGSIGKAIKAKAQAEKKAIPEIMRTLSTMKYQEQENYLMNRKPLERRVGIMRKTMNISSKL